MSYGYIQGQEAQALVYYKKLVQTTANPDERKKLDAIIAFLEKVIADKPQAAVIGENSISNNAGMVTCS